MPQDEEKEEVDAPILLKITIDTVKPLDHGSWGVTKYVSVYPKEYYHIENLEWGELFLGLIETHITEKYGKYLP